MGNKRQSYIPYASIVQIFVVLQTAKISAIRDQCRRVGNLFWSNTKRHRETVQMGKPKMKLIQEIETWWNGTVCHASKIIRRTWNFFTSLNSTQCSWTMDSLKSSRSVSVPFHLSVTPLNKWTNGVLGKRQNNNVSSLSTRNICAIWKIVFPKQKLLKT